MRVGRGVNDGVGVTRLPGVSVHVGGKTAARRVEAPDGLNAADEGQVDNLFGQFL